MGSQLTPDEMCLFMSTDVRLWLDYRRYHNRPSLKRFFDYAIVPRELLDKEFDIFKESLPNGESCFPHSKLIAYWAKANQQPLAKVDKYGKVYMTMSSRAIDDLAGWMERARLAFEIHGTDLFRY